MAVPSAALTMRSRDPQLIIDNESAKICEEKNKEVL